MDLFDPETPTACDSTSQEPEKQSGGENPDQKIKALQAAIQLFDERISKLEEMEIPGLHSKQVVQWLQPLSDRVKRLEKRIKT